MVKMLKLAILLIVGVIARQAYGDAPEAIVGGNIATEGQFPYQVSLQTFRLHNCGGSIISDRHIVTAAHCVDNRFYNMFLTVVIGTHKLENGEKHSVKCIRVHPDYTGKIEDAWKNDIAVITLKEPITFSNLQNKIPLATQDYTTGSYLGITSGWGQTSVGSDPSPILKWLEVNVLSSSDCLKAHKLPPTNTKQICTLKREHGVCSGDSGGPLVINGELCGVTSWVIPCARNIPDVFTNIYYYLDFITECQSFTGNIIEDAAKDDIAVITLQKPIIFNKVQSSIPLATQDYTTGTYTAITSGWGLTDFKKNKSSPQLKWLKVNILSKSDCLNAHEGIQMNSKQICVFEKKGQGVCSGDSGGPLIVNGELCGITSWGAECASGMPDVFTNVYCYLDFIKECQKTC
ncbi:PREDICTED: trypsin-2-like [Dinoponera quadriceps]|uniref:Trypsin-2-like n=1 Tax=Dinoponera quadriceps TaxID=609295 RepID=A0A6P3X768_DINQU|nr:PREDICTED: trypsin-2-like [Dinoponera quadriceps]